MTADYVHPLVRRGFILSGPLLMVVFCGAVLGPMGFIPPPRPTWSAQRIAEFYGQHQTAIMFGALIWCVGSVLLVLWAAALIAQCRRVEGAHPILAYAQIIFAACDYVVALLCGMSVAIAAYRPDDVLPDLTRMWNDIFWFLIEFTWPPFAAWMLLVALIVFSDKSPVPLYPRWVGYVNLWCALLMVPGGLMGFFKAGPFAFDGLMSCYILIIAFVIWMVTMTVPMYRAQLRDERAENTAKTGSGVAQHPAEALAR
ncbi:hypothetical protein ABQF35_05075 [Mycobacterium syngnathidarum]